MSPTNQYYQILPQQQELSSPTVSSSSTSSSSNYNFHYCIGTGNFGDVYKATHRASGTIVAVKVVDLEEFDDEIKVLTQEIHFLSRMKSENITTYHEAFTQDWNMFIVMEYCGGGSCSELLKVYRQLPEDMVSYIIREVLKGLQYLHSEHKVHRDIKSANILLTEDGKVKLADFGVSGELTLTRIKKKTFVGTPFWMAPEVITRGKTAEQPNQIGYDVKADIWSTGITTIELINGYPPLAQFKPLEVLFEIPRQRPPTLDGSGYSENLKDFVKYCLIKDPSKRPNASTLLKHHFITKCVRYRTYAQTTLARVVAEKNRYLLQKGKLVKKAKHSWGSGDQNNNNANDLNNKVSGGTNIEWQFHTVIKPIQRDLSTNSCTMEQTLLQTISQSPNLPHNELLPVEKSNETTSRPSSPANPAPVSAPIPASISIPIPNPIPIPASTRGPASAPVPSRIASNIQANGQKMLLSCLERVYHRAKSDDTKNSVVSLIHDIQRYERKVPGLCDAIVEEFLNLQPQL
ncbi:hypothetical protein DFJ63DRAFT_322508 [Scheffersomyces coipomensis]|uniref:uncharacterized protein n=1 Tax=Scheffersomyces coipomensis TaxID=1788519 RepID=UPI00315DD1B3